MSQVRNIQMLEATSTYGRLIPKKLYEFRFPKSQLGERASLVESLTLAELQTKSGFFMKLPLEIRRSIYVFASGAILCLEHVDDPNHKYFELECLGVKRVQGISRTCRQAYLESIEYLYSENTFYMDNICSLMCLPMYTHPDYFQWIRSIHLKWPHYHRIFSDRFFEPGYSLPPTDEATWEAAWKLIASMKGLRHIRISMIDDTRPPYQSFFREKELLRPLNAITGIKEFHVSTSWTLHPRDQQLANGMTWSFQIYRGDANHIFEYCPYPGCQNEQDE